MSETKFQKIDFHWKDKSLFIIVYFIAMILVIYDTKERYVKLELGIANGLPIYVTTAGLVLIGVYWGIYYFILRGKSNWGYKAIRHMAIDFKDNVTSLLTVNALLTINLAMELKQHFNIANLSLVLSLYFILLCLPLVFTKFIVIVHNRVIDLMDSNEQSAVIRFKEKYTLIRQKKFHIQAWFFPTLSIFVLWIVVGIFLLKIGDENLLSDWINSAVAIGTIALAVFGWMAYKEYWRQKKDVTIYDRIVRSTSLMHSRILQFQRAIDHYSMNITMHLNVTTVTGISVGWLNDLIHVTNTCLSTIKDFESIISEWEAELDYINLFTESINKKLITSKLEKQFKDFKKDLPNLYSQISNIKNQLLEYSKNAPQDSLSKIQLKITPIEITNISIKDTEDAIKDFIKQAINKFS